MTNSNIALLPMQGIQQQGQAINNGFNAYYQSQNNARQNNLLELTQKKNAESAERNNKLLELQQDEGARSQQMHDIKKEQITRSNSQEDDQIKRTKAVENMQILQGAAEALLSVPEDQRAAQLQSILPQISQFMDPSKLEGQPLDDISLSNFKGAVGIALSKLSDNQHFAPTAAIDENGEPVFIQGSKGGDVNRISGFTPMKQTAEKESEIRINEAKEKANIDVEKDISKLSGKAKEERIISVIDTGIAAAEVAPTYDRMLELVEATSTGGTQAGIQKAKQLFGWGAADIGELDALFKEAVLSNLKKMGANPTEGERQFLLESSGSISQSPAVLKRLISRRKEQAINSVNKGKKWATERGDTEALDLMGFGEQQETPQQNEDNQALEWAKSNPNDPRAQTILQIRGGG